MEALLLEYEARKAHVLSIEMRIFVTVLALQTVFLTSPYTGALRAALVFATLFALLLALYGKLRLLSVYLRQVEAQLAARGQTGCIWESRIVDGFLFRGANRFTVPALCVVLALVAESFFMANDAAGVTTGLAAAFVAAVLMALVALVPVHARDLFAD